MFKNRIVRKLFLLESSLYLLSVSLKHKFNLLLNEFYFISFHRYFIFKVALKFEAFQIFLKKFFFKSKSEAFVLFQNNPIPKGLIPNNILYKARSFTFWKYKIKNLYIFMKRNFLIWTVKRF